jgi:hypothetical protein
MFVVSIRWETELLVRRSYSHFILGHLQSLFMLKSSELSGSLGFWTVSIAWYSKKKPQKNKTFRKLDPFLSSGEL